jgi:hypothetical protein
MMAVAGMVLGVALAAGLVPTPVDTAKVENALAADESALQQHRGFLAYLDAHPDFAQAEMNYLALATLPSVYPRLVQFEESLQRDPAAELQFDRYYDRLARQPALRGAVEQLQRIEFGQRDGGDAFGQAMAYLRANPDTALRFLQRPGAVSPTPDALYPVVGYLQSRPELRAELGGALEGFLQQPDATTDVVPWFGKVLQQGAALTPPLIDSPNRHWAWHQRNLAQAADAQARAWTRHWYRVTRRTSGLGYAYLQYLRQLREQPTRARAAEARWIAEAGEVPAWPPAPAPPELPVLKDAASDVPAARTGDGRVQRPEKPARPEVKRPPRPEMPEAPRKPTRPAKPVVVRPAAPSSE